MAALAGNKLKNIFACKKIPLVKPCVQATILTKTKLKTHAMLCHVAVYVLSD